MPNYHYQTLVKRSSHGKPLTSFHERLKKVGCSGVQSDPLRGNFDARINGASYGHLNRPINKHKPMARYSNPPFNKQEPRLNNFNPRAKGFELGDFQIRPRAPTRVPRDPGRLLGSPGRVLDD
jgi:hypothetical protein